MNSIRYMGLSLVNQLLFADNTALVVDLEKKLCQLVEEFGRVCRRNLRVNENKSKLMKCTRMVGGRRMNVALNGELHFEVECFEYLRSKVTVYGGIETEVKSRINDVGKVLGGMKKVVEGWE